MLKVQFLLIKLERYITLPNILQHEWENYHFLCICCLLNMNLLSKCCITSQFCKKLH